MIELLFFGMLILMGIYIFYFLVYSSIKAEKDFSLDVHRFLSRRYPKTSIVDYGGLASDPIILSREAGPFRIIEIKVVTEKEANKTDQDLILRGEVDPLKFKRGSSSTPNLSLHPQFRWGQSTNDIEIGIPSLDNRFIISSNDSLFPRHLLVQSDLGNLFQKSFDLEGFYIRWSPESESPVVQVRMETMNLNSFIQAFNILLGTVGILSEKGYLTRNIGKSLGKETPSPIEQSVPSVYTYSQLTDYARQTVVSRKASEADFIGSADTQKEIISKSEDPAISWEPLPVSTGLSEPIGEIDQEKADHAKAALAESPYKPLFSSISYQVKAIDFLPSSVKISTFSSSNQEILVTFPNDALASFSAISSRSLSEKFDLNVSFNEKARQTDWNDPWKAVTVSGSPEIVEKFQARSGVAHRITNTGEVMITVEGHPDTNRIDYEVIVPQTIRGINAGYSLLKDIIWFFEMMYM